MKELRAILLFCCLAFVFSCKPEPVGEKPQIPISVSDVRLSNISVEMEVGETSVLEAFVIPVDATDKKVSWASSDPSVVLVDGGKLTAVSEGKATVTVTTDDGGKTAVCSVKVGKDPVTVQVLLLDVDEVLLYPGEEYTLKADVFPKDAEDKHVVWKSSDSKVATVDEEGNVKAVSSGEARITASVGNGSDFCVVTVTEQPLTFTASSPSTVALCKYGTPYALDFQYSLSGGAWEVYSIGNYIKLAEGESVSFRTVMEENDKFSRNESSYYYFDIEGSVDSSGNIMSLVDKTQKQEKVSDSGFYQLFMYCDGLVSAPELTAKTLGVRSYEMMFAFCRNLVYVPDLSAVNLGRECCRYMFWGCSSLVSAPYLPSISMAEGCYSMMYSECESLTNAPDLPAILLAKSCYSSMFYGCKSLVRAPELPAEEMAAHCYGGMFSGCTSLVNAPELPARKLADYCYSGMFSSCAMTSAPELPARTLAPGCYSSMFSGCTSLGTAPELPAESLAVSCYEAMFYVCKSLRRSPYLPALRLQMDSYRLMFYGCSSLDYVEAMFTMENQQQNIRFCLDGWLDGTSSEGTFVRNPDAVWSATQAGIPEGWTIIEQE